MPRENNKKRPLNRSYLRELIRAVIVLAVAVTVFILAGNENFMSRIKRLAGMETAATVCADDPAH